MFLKKLTNWLLHKLENSLEWSITSNQQANFINFNPIEQNPQIGFKINPSIFNFSQNPKLIKLTNQDHVYNSIPTKPNDEFQKNNVKSTKIPSLKRSENSIKMHEIMHEIMKIRTKGGVKRSYRPYGRKTLQKLGRKRQKIFCAALPSWRERERENFKKSSEKVFDSVKALVLKNLKHDVRLIEKQVWSIELGRGSLNF